MRINTYKTSKIMLLLIAMAIALMFVSCDIHKVSQKSKSDTEFKENIETKSFRKGDTVHYQVPRITYRDTTIYTINRQGTTLKTVYDNAGNISSIDCFASVIEEIRKENREFQQAIKDKEKEKTEKFDSTWLIYVMGAIVIVLAIAMFAMYKFFDKKTAMLNFQSKE